MTIRLNGSTSGFTELDAPAVAGSNTLVLPGGNGSANQRLVTDGSGTLSFSSDIMLSAGSAGSPSLYFSGDTNTGMWSPGAGSLAWSTDGFERVRITSGGQFLVGATTAYGDGSNGTPGFQFFAYTGVYAGCASVANTTSDLVNILFKNPNGVVGTIRTNGSATSYNTSSDYRLKENICIVTDGITRLQQLKPSRFNFIADPDTVVYGFIAHEAQEVVPECVTGTKDEVDDDGNPVYQGIDQSKLVPLLTAALQEAIAKIESLEARLTALEATP
jgi:hypothetical protein